MWKITINSVGESLGLEDPKILEVQNKPKIFACGEMTGIQFYAPDELVVYYRSAILQSITIVRIKKEIPQ